MRTALRWIVIVFCILAALLVAVALAGAMLPKDHRVIRTVVVKASPPEVWTTITDHTNEPRWRHDVASVTRLADRNGHELVEERYTNGQSMRLETVESQPPSRLVRDVVDNDIFTGRWTYELKAEEGGTRVTITEQGSVPNPVFRFVSRFIIGQTTTIDRYMRSLSRRDQTGNGQ
jgi:uncharacterized protein YndB with AHSA1/START domain